MKTQTLPDADTTILELLNMGAKITFESGRSLKGRLGDRYIAVANDYGSLGLWDLDSKTGVNDAVADLVRDAAESDMDIHGGAIEQTEDDDVA